VPEGASIHDKSYYTSNKDHLFYELQDISLHVLAHSQADLAHAASMYTLCLWTIGFMASMVVLGADLFVFYLVLGKFKAL
jgi:hypothetical protein